MTMDGAAATACGRLGDFGRGFRGIRGFADCRGPCGLRRGVAGGPEPQVAPRRPLAPALLPARSHRVRSLRGTVPSDAVSSRAVSSGAVSSRAVSSGAVSSDAVSFGLRARAQGPCPCRRPPRLRRYPQPRRLPHRLQGRAVRGSAVSAAALSVRCRARPRAPRDGHTERRDDHAVHAGQFGSVRHHGHKAHDPGAVPTEKASGWRRNPPEPPLRAVPIFLAVEPERDLRTGGRLTGDHGRAVGRDTDLVETWRIGGAAWCPPQCPRARARPFRARRSRVPLTPSFGDGVPRTRDPRTRHPRTRHLPIPDLRTRHPRTWRLHPAGGPSSRVAKTATATRHAQTDQDQRRSP